MRIFRRDWLIAVARQDKKDVIVNVKSDVPLPVGWFYSNAEESDLRHDELLRELTPGHPLFDMDVDVVAHREGTDDILCRHHTDPDRLTVVHLTWRGGPEMAPGPTHTIAREFLVLLQDSRGSIQQLDVA